MALPGGTTFSDISRPADPRRLRRNGLPLADLGTSGGSKRNSVHPSFGPAWTQVKLVPRTVLSFSIVLLLSESSPFVHDHWQIGRRILLPGFLVGSQLAHAAVDVEFDAGDVRRIVGGEE